MEECFLASTDSTPPDFTRSLYMHQDRRMLPSKNLNFKQNETKVACCESKCLCWVVFRCGGRCGQSQVSCYRHSEIERSKNSRITERERENQWDGNCYGECRLHQNLTPSQNNETAAAAYCDTQIKRNLWNRKTQTQEICEIERSSWCSLLWAALSLFGIVGMRRKGRLPSHDGRKQNCEIKTLREGLAPKEVKCG